ncbi:conserved hypothetical protein [Methylobacterium sp. 4-46]|uniref:hypothetical protein n=1 Tax=unclassified Methylobacterium TaxID=2615210 RepID=UPI000152D4F3|nr:MULTISPECIES: hypothetical protein [Methylobacterium]ACA20896.1 conserved hypothetical protein [Methylobacterium sp. 4-46]WFT80050.1 hypothetical protein QA634_33545 [Methylobacterium nodulans]
MFTLEINGTPVAVIRATETQARELLDVEGFKDDLRTMTTEGRPLWSGEDSALKLRPSTEDEVDTFDEAMEEDEEFDEEPDDSGATAASGTSDEEEPDDVDILFLIDIDDEAEH